MNSLGLKRVTFYCIRHIKSNRIMPEVKTRGGYSHWNPDNPDAPISMFFDSPRLFETKERAKRSIVQWFVCQNGRRHFSQNNYTGEFEDDIIYKEDGRKKEDLEVIKIRLLRVK